MNLKIRRFWGSFLLCSLLLCCSGCGILMGAVGAPLYYIKEEAIKPKPLKVKIEEDRIEALNESESE